MYPQKRHSGLYIQSLRGDPLADMRFSVLVNYRDPAYPLELITVDMLGEEEGEAEVGRGQGWMGRGPEELEGDDQRRRTRRGDAAKDDEEGVSGAKEERGRTVILGFPSEEILRGLRRAREVRGRGSVRLSACQPCLPSIGSLY